MAVHENLKRLRLACNYTQGYVAQQIDVKQQCYQKYESGERKIPADKVILLAKVLDTTVASIYGEEEPKKAAHKPDEKHVVLYEKLLEEKDKVIKEKERVIALLELNQKKKED